MSEKRSEPSAADLIAAFIKRAKESRQRIVRATAESAVFGKIKFLR
jgi:hypothetical protein